MPSEAGLVFRRHFLRLKQRIGNLALPVHGNLHLKTICIPKLHPHPCFRHLHPVRIGQSSVFRLQ